MEVTVKRPTMLVKALLEQASLDLDLSVERDVATLQRRCEHEGLSFLTITLPLLSDALERGLEAGTFSCPGQFARQRSLPRFMGGFFKRVFNKDGKLLDNPCAEAICWIRQVARFFKKLKTLCSKSRMRDAAQHFVDVEGELRRMTSQIERKDLLLDKISGIIWAQVFPELDVLDLVCHHGPGVTADRYLSNERNRIRKWNHRSELTYPSDLHCFPNYGVAAEVSGTWDRSEANDGIEYLDLKEELPVRVVFVPKTATAPRVIAIEPSHVQFMQQSVKDFVYKVVEGHSLTRNSIRFSDQRPNQRLAYRSSIDKRLATLDLKDASDRVHLHLVQRIFKTSGLLPFLEDARSLHATLPDGRNIVLNKYASMGSALCFPVEAMVFYTLIQTAMHQLDGRRPSSRSIRDYSQKIDIYGDDIIIPVEYTDVVVNYLESYALKVNVNKSFRHSNFRESCGADFYNGVAVNPVYARKELHDDSRHWGAEEIMAWNATADLFYIRGKWHVCQVIRSLLSRVVKSSIPRSTTVGSGLVHFSFIYTTNLRWNRDLCGWKQKRLHFDPITKKDTIDGDEIACLNKWGQHVHARARSSGTSGSNTVGLRLGHEHFLERARGGSTTEDESSRFISRSGAVLDSRSGSGAGHQNGVIDSPVSDCGVRSLQDLSDFYGTEIPPVQSVACNCESAGTDVVGSSDPTRTGKELSADYCLTEEPVSDPLYHLSGDISGLDFLASTKRGAFKSKRRWVSLAS